jgi:hypothetical protein
MNLFPLASRDSARACVCTGSGLVWLARSLVLGWEFRPAFFPALVSPSRRFRLIRHAGRRSSTPSVTIQFVHFGSLCTFWCSPIETVQRVGCERKSTDLARRIGGGSGRECGGSHQFTASLALSPSDVSEDRLLVVRRIDSHTAATGQGSQKKKVHTSQPFVSKTNDLGGSQGETCRGLTEANDSPTRVGREMRGDLSVTLPSKACV